ncbi:hypothetical protein [Pontiella sulfatireligans]|uniref:Uncharacterized protein n=1 Tax=Pontiella sulfatireligans TaxID=2750658 RepID=A0A6C2UVA8_9BACT|nr:hypothetical protein [Pontiella sulfatireligans]VGO23047.1 hypothetical protein SCARR_05146 [Pontiella sulfatireligans]
MKLYIKLVVGCALALGCAVSGFAVEVTLEATKDTFGRSNNRNRNNGGSSALLVAHNASAWTIIAFDLSAVTNEIGSAEFQFRKNNTMAKPISLVVAPMVQTKNNAAWGEGAGNLGAKGQNSKLGEASYAWSSFRDVPWESASGAALVGLNDSGLWNAPVARLDGLPWQEGQWVAVPVVEVSLLETIRQSEFKTATFGLWGTAGYGLYSISSKESGSAPKLVLTLKEARGGQK